MNKIDKYTNAKNYSKWIMEGILSGVFAGITVTVYRFGLTHAENILAAIWNYIRGNALFTALWFVALLLLAAIVGGLLRIESRAGGSGLPQLAAEIEGAMDPCWWKVIIIKLVSAVLCILGGLSLGRVGPSIQFGAMAGKGVSLIPGNERELRENRLRLLCCGAGAGLAATFHVPLAGFLFIIEELRRGFDRAIVVTGITATLTADMVSRVFFGNATVFSYTAGSVPLTHYGVLVLLGVILGLAGAFYNFSMVKMQLLFKHFKKIPQEIRLMVPFLLAGILGLVLPQVLGGGRPMVAILMGEHPALSTLAILLIVKFIFSVICSGSGAPGGIFFPLFVMGAYIGAICGDVSVQFLGLDAALWQQFIILGMAGFFTGILRLPLTGIAITAEITGSIAGLPDIIIVVLAAYVTANLTRTKSIIKELRALLG